MMTIEPPATGEEAVELLEKQTSYDGFFKVVRYRLRHRLFSGQWSGEIGREVFERGDAVAVLPYDPITDEVVLIQQFRVGAYAYRARAEASVGDGCSEWLIECIAGMIDKDASAQKIAELEAREEANIALDHLTPMLQVYSSPGGISERMFLFVATVDSTTATGIHGLATENEDIKVLRVKRQQAMTWLKNGLIENATTVIALQWLQLNLTQWLSSLGLKSSEQSSLNGDDDG